MNEENLQKVNFDFEALDECPLCLGKVSIPSGRINWLDTDFWYVVCPNCGLKFMNPRPTRESYKTFYEDLFWQQKVRNLGFHQSGQAWQSGQYKWDNEKQWEPEFGRQNLSDKLSALRIETITSNLQKHIELGKNTKILEVGCGFPVTLQSLHDNFGCQVYAIEPSAEAQEVIKKSGDIKLLAPIAEELENISKSDEKFDAIIFSHVLENTTNPFAIMGYAADALKDGGLVYIQTPNLLVCDQMNPYHPYIFCNNSLRMMVEKAGLKYQRISDPKERMLTAVNLKR